MDYLRKINSLEEFLNSRTTNYETLSERDIDKLMSWLDGTSIRELQLVLKKLGSFFAIRDLLIRMINEDPLRLSNLGSSYKKSLLRFIGLKSGTAFKDNENVKRFFLSQYHHLIDHSYDKNSWDKLVKGFKNFLGTEKATRELKKFFLKNEALLRKYFLNYKEDDFSKESIKDFIEKERLSNDPILEEALKGALQESNEELNNSIMSAKSFDDLRVRIQNEDLVRRVTMEEFDHILELVESSDDLDNLYHIMSNQSENLIKAFLERKMYKEIDDLLSINFFFAEDFFFYMVDTHDPRIKISQEVETNFIAQLTHQFEEEENEGYNLAVLTDSGSSRELVKEVFRVMEDDDILGLLEHMGFFDLGIDLEVFDKIFPKNDPLTLVIKSRIKKGVDVDEEIRDHRDLKNDFLLTMGMILNDEGILTRSEKELDHGGIITFRNGREIRGVYLRKNKLALFGVSGLNDVILSLDLRKINPMKILDSIGSIISKFILKYRKEDIMGNLDEYLEDIIPSYIKTNFTVFKGMFQYNGIEFKPSGNSLFDEQVISYLDNGLRQGQKLKVAKSLSSCVKSISTRI